MPKTSIYFFTFQILVKLSKFLSQIDKIFEGRLLPIFFIYGLVKKNKLFFCIFEKK